MSPASNHRHFIPLDNDESCLTADWSNIGRPNGQAYYTGELLDSTLASLINECRLSRQLSSSRDNLLTKPAAKLSLTDRAFSVSAPSLWSSHNFVSVLVPTDVGLNLNCLHRHLDLRTLTRCHLSTSNYFFDEWGCINLILYCIVSCWTKAH